MRILIVQICVFSCPHQIIFYLQNKMQYIDQAVNHIIRPTRDSYLHSRLGPTNFTLKDKRGSHISYHRQDIQLHVRRKKQVQKIQLSYYQSKKKLNNPNCLIYLHANSGSRIQSLPYIYPLLSNMQASSLQICTFDSLGSGLSSGQYITLGIEEAIDLYEVIKYTARQRNIKRFILWGRSMGACSVLVFTNNYYKKLLKKGLDITGIILDSPFCDLKKVVKQLVAQRTSMPEFIFGPFLYFVERQLKEKIDKTFEDYQMEKYLKSSQYIPALFMVSKNDKLVKAIHCEDLFNQYLNRNKQLYYIEVEHHEKRDEQIINKCLQFINRSLKTQPKKPYKGITKSETQVSDEQVIFTIYDHESQKINNKKFSFQSKEAIIKSPVEYQTEPLNYVIQEKKHMLSPKKNSNTRKDHIPNRPHILSYNPPSRENSQRNISNRVRLSSSREINRRSNHNSSKQLRKRINLSQNERAPMNNPQLVLYKEPVHRFGQPPGFQSIYSYRQNSSEPQINRNPFKTDSGFRTHKQMNTKAKIGSGNPPKNNNGVLKTRAKYEVIKSREDLHKTPY